MRHLLLHTVTVVNPSVAIDDYGNTVYDYATGEVIILSPGAEEGGAWLQQNTRSEPFEEGRAPDEERWLMITEFADVHDKARVTWTRPELPSSAYVFNVDGPPEPVYAGVAKTYHHLETTLRQVAG